VHCTGAKGLPVQNCHPEAFFRLFAEGFTAFVFELILLQEFPGFRLQGGTEIILGNFYQDGAILNRVPGDFGQGFFQGVIDSVGNYFPLLFDQQGMLIFVLCADGFDLCLDFFFHSNLFLSSRSNFFLQMDIAICNYIIPHYVKCVKND